VLNRKREEARRASRLTGHLAPSTTITAIVMNWVKIFGLSAVIGCEFS
jgi:hypothetical protein